MGRVQIGDEGQEEGRVGTPRLLAGDMGGESSLCGQTMGLVFRLGDFEVSLEHTQRLTPMAVYVFPQRLLCARHGQTPPSCGCQLRGILQGHPLLEIRRLQLRLWHPLYFREQGVWKECVSTLEIVRK